MKIIGMQFLDFFDFLTNSVMMPIAALMTSLLVARVVGVKKIEEEIIHGESAFRRKKIFAVMIKYLCPIFVTDYFDQFCGECIWMDFYVEYVKKGV